MLANVTFERFTEHTLANIDELLVELAQVREQGYAEDNEENENGLRCFAVPIYNRMGRIITGLSLSLPIVRFEESKRAELVSLLHEAAGKISAELGYHNYPFTPR
ncbi:Transcriptional regulator KdgR [compost metagenome]